ncbi:MAG: Ig-like domain-containing protein, partial [Pseudonocardiales bacterium]|nr:Ig-like domain-containing protein [Pseudonocardiales bacterium]
MFKFYRSVLTAGIITFGLTACGDDVTITDPPGPPAPGVTSVTVAPSTATVAVGQSVVFAASVIADNGVSTAVTWTSSNPLIATVNGTGQVTGVAAGTTTIIATSSADNGKTGIGTITVAGVGGGAPAQISIQSITTGMFNTPVQLNNVNGQIEVNLNFNPGGQMVDSVRVLIGGKAAATQRFASNAAAGILSMSVNTANYTKNVAAGTTTVDFFNGPATITAVVYTAGGGTTSTQGTQIVLNNTSGFAANITRPTQSGTGVPASTALGQTYWGGPGAGGVTSVTVFPVIYESGRSVNTVTFGLGPQAGIGCPTVTDATLPFTQSFGYTGTGLATVNCTNYEWLATNAGGARDNVYVLSAIDNTSNAFANTALIPNTTVFGSTPDSLRVDYFAPTSVTAPVILGTEGFNWLNDAATIR